MTVHEESAPTSSVSGTSDRVRTLRVVAQKGKFTGGE